MDDGALSQTARLRAFLKALKYSRRSDLAACLDIVLAEAFDLEEKDLFVILTYLDKAPIAAKTKVMHEILSRLVPHRKERIMGWLTQPYYEQGLAEGELKGMARGEAKGEAKLLTRVLEKRFGAIPAVLGQRIFAADTAAIEAWTDRALDAHDLQSVFESPAL